MIEDAVRAVAEAVSQPVEPEHITMFAWLLDHLREEGGMVAGGFVAYFMHTIYHHLWKRPAHALIRRLTRPRK